LLGAGHGISNVKDSIMRIFCFACAARRIAYACPRGEWRGITHLLHATTVIQQLRQSVRRGMHGCNAVAAKQQRHPPAADQIQFRSQYVPTKHTAKMHDGQ